jgi:uncharacterized protein
MIDQLEIEKNKVLLPAQDYSFLRATGIDYVQSLSGQIWTDHNLHDPGITILEILCYALTDLGYRTAFDLKDLLAAEDGSVEPPEISGLFPAHEILTSTPLTILDYRKLLLKIEGVRNAWLDPMTDPGQVGNYRESEIPIFADCVEGALSYQPLNKLGAENQRVRLSGLYRVLLELEIDDLFGSLNEHRLVYQVRRGPLKGLIFSLDSQDPAFDAVDFGTDLANVLQVESLAQSARGFSARVRVGLAGGGELVLDELVLVVLEDRPVPGQAPVTVALPELDALLADEAADALIPVFWAKQRARQRSIEAVGCVLNTHRNLCEDFLSIRTVEPEHVAVCADIELKPDADLEAVQARVFHAIELYFNPPVRYYTLKELLDEGLCADDIFNGPYVAPAFRCGGQEVFTKAGFVKDEELQASELRRVVYVSDIINILMDFPEIVSIKNVLLRKVDVHGNPVGGSEKWCLPITPLHQPVLSIEASKILFFKNGFPYRARRTEFQETLDYLRAMAHKAAYVEPNQELPVPRGRYRNPGQYYSIQHDFPQTYGIGSAGLPAMASDTRVAQARQFKAYLTFYDQMLADYLAQLANVRRLFSLDKALPTTYFSQYLSEIAGVRGQFPDEFYVDKAKLSDDAQRTRLTEDEELFQERRNRLLDHLTARFAEQFTDYVLMMFNLNGDRLKTGRDLIDDKIDFLREYPVVSRERHKAFNYRPEDPAQIWDTENVSGLEKRVSRLAGIDDYSRRDLACDEVFSGLFGTSEVGSGFRLEIPDSQGTAIFRSVESFPDADAALAAARTLYPFIRQEKSYQVDASGGTGSIRYRIVAGGASLENDMTFDTAADAIRSARAIVDRYDEILLTEDACDEEGFHLIEHILLRPTTDQDALFDVCLDPGCLSCGDEDPYTFRVQVVLPYWPRRFRNLDFRRFFEQTLREETPAHIHVRICWVSNEQMAELDATYRAWIEARAATPVVQADLTQALKELIDILQRLKTVYPAATLHDCIEGENENPVRLGSTNLGIF